MKVHSNMADALDAAAGRSDDSTSDPISWASRQQVARQITNLRVSKS
jgi:hypothetical protein